jgi:NAD(P)-dependent dehydrogenase (short-subunit alcohol dehydrogenase family)
MPGTLLVTGGGRGIGAAVARLGAARGYAVCVNYRSDAVAAEAVVAEIERAGGRALALPPTWRGRRRSNGCSTPSMPNCRRSPPW